MPLLSSKAIAVGETVYALGYPGSVTEHSVTSSGINDITVTNGIISQHMQDAYANETWVLMHTALISDGNSGGPLITAQGAVVGVNTYLFDDDRYCAVYIDYIMDAMDKGSIPYQVYGETTGPGETTVPGPGPGPGGESSNKLLIAAGILLIVLAAAVIAVIKIQNKAVSGKSNHKKNPAPGPTTPVYPTFKLKMPDGRIIPVYDKPMLIGRDPSCDIRIPGEYTNIGRKHCSLQVLQGQLILTDMGSLNGTFIHGKRVPTNARVALKNGSSFAIGQSDYVITVI